MIIINVETCKKEGLTPSEYIAKHFKDELAQNQALVSCISKKAMGKGYLLGIATKNELGYTATDIILAEHDYNTVSKWVDNANALIFDREPADTFRIVLSSMRFS